MSQCCNSSSTEQVQVKNYPCPVNGKHYNSVSTDTILHHIKEPWLWHNKQQGYYFCEDPDCDVVYYGQDDSIIGTSALRTKVGIKEQTEQSIICYCFGINKSEAKNLDIKQFVIKKTKQNICACTIRNPSGQCCLKHFTKINNKYQTQG